MASLTYAQAQSLLAPFITSQGSSDPAVGSAINFVNERFITGGQWKGNRFIYSFNGQNTLNNVALTYVGKIITGTYANHGLSVGTLITINTTSPSSQTAYVGTFQVTAPVTTNTFTFTSIYTPTANATASVIASAFTSDSSGTYIDTPVGVDSILKIIAVDTNQAGEIGTIMNDWFTFQKAGLGYLQQQYSGDFQIVRQGPTPASPLPSGNTSDGQRYRLIGEYPELRTMYCLVKRAYVPLVNPTDLLIPSNINAYRYGVQAYNYENINELERAQVYWDLAYKCLNDALESYQEGVQDGVEIQWDAFRPSLVQNLI
jgi:hypothetical protein